MAAQSLDADTLRKRLKQAPQAQGEESFRLQPFGANLHLARLIGGELAVIAVLEGRPRTAAVEYGGLRVRIIECADVRIGSRHREAALCVMSCVDEALHHNFCILAADLYGLAERNPDKLQTAPQFLEFITQWAELFARRRQLSESEELGLWGELEVLRSLPDVDLGVGAWHGPDAATFDFGANDVIVEVKSSTGGHQHYFGLEQLSAPSAKSQLLIASLVTVADPASGVSLDMQVGRVRRLLSATLEFDRKIANLGYRVGTNISKYSVKELLYFSGIEIPRPRQIDGGVSGVRFIADLQGKKPIDRKALVTTLRRLAG